MIIRPEAVKASYQEATSTVLGDQQHHVSSITDYLEETETCYKCDDEVASLKEVIANQSALLAQQAGQLAQQAGHLAQQAGHLAQQAGLISSLQSQMDSVVARVDSAEQFMNTCNAPSNCTEVAERSGINNQAFYVIDPDGPERGVLPMVVQCDVQGDKSDASLHPSDKCNCDANDYTWREDSGFLSHKDDLPVTQLRFGDTGDSGEEGYYTLGKLICYP
ncbi:contactin-associated protein-like 2 [Branchiostoma floridae]|uniref:Contactin-associated protein-like 2 n=1 Tax=Branchiostoma floridae TaxID=7739 RepID=A0A9J7M402_BRAFL|nr:contactin-associated protein-like 2 [Branchiostoma floridae]